eukprot:1396159-Pyramimonas_sp.AAC.1
MQERLSERSLRPRTLGQNEFATARPELARGFAFARAATAADALAEAAPAQRVVAGVGVAPELHDLLDLRGRAARALR